MLPVSKERYNINGFGLDEMDLKRLKSLVFSVVVLLFASHTCVLMAAEHKPAHKIKAAHKKVIHKNKIAHKNSAHKASLHKAKVIANAQPANYIMGESSSIDATTHEAEGVVGLVQQTVSNLHYSSYKYGGTCFDPFRGIYILDCSNYVDRIIQSVYPYAYQNLISSTGSENPSSRHYYNFFTRLSDNHRQYWNKVRDVEQLQPGDVLVFHYLHGRRSFNSGGHVMLVMNKPIKNADEFIIQVADSARTGHSQDTRPRHASGIGIGTLLLKVNHTGHPIAFAWRFDSYWEKNVSFAMARPVNIHL